MPKKRKSKWTIQDYVTIVRNPMSAYSSTIGPLVGEGHAEAGLFDIMRVRLFDEYIIVTRESLVALIERLQKAEVKKAL